MMNWVSTGPGDTAETVMPVPRSSSASAIENVRSPNLVAE